MTLKLVQICNRCTVERELSLGYSGSGIVTASYMHAGWRRLDNKDVCPACIRDFIDQMGA